jgi:hypothetical protein
MGFGLIIQRRSQVLGGGGRNAPEWVAGINRNARPEWIGIGGRNQSESVAGMRRNTHILQPNLFRYCLAGQMQVFPDIKVNLPQPGKRGPPSKSALPIHLFSPKDFHAPIWW